MKFTSISITFATISTSSRNA